MRGQREREASAKESEEELAKRQKENQENKELRRGGKGER